MEVYHKQSLSCNDLSDQNLSPLVNKMSNDLYLSSIILWDILLNSKAENTHPKS